MPSVDALVTAIRAARERIRDAARTSEAAHERADKLRDELASLGTEERAADVNSVAAEIETEHAQIDAVAGQVGTALVQAEALRGTGSGGGGAPPSPAAGGAPERPWSRNPPVPGFRPDRPNPTCIEQARRTGWPTNQNGRVSARGRLYDAGGRPITGTVQAGAGPAVHAADLKKPWASNGQMRTRWHIEGHASAVMRTHNLQDGVLYLNISPCGATDRDQWRCHENLSHALPPGSTLRVWVARQDGGVDQFKYQGTGKALK